MNCCTANKYRNHLERNYQYQLKSTSGCNSTQSAKSASATNSSALRGRNLTATRTLPGTTLKIETYNEQ
jgi:hypothetical protein